MPSKCIALTVLLSIPAGAVVARAQAAACQPDPVYPLVKYCAERVDAARRNGTIEAAPRRDAASPPESRSSIAEGLLEDRFISKVTDPSKQNLIKGIARKSPRLAATLEGADGAFTVGGILEEPATAISLVRGPGLLGPATGFIDASWPDETSPLQGNQRSPDQHAKAERDRLAFVMTRCMPRAWPDGTSMTQPLPSVPPPGCPSQEEMEGYDRAASKTFDSEARVQRESWIAEREYAGMLDEAVKAGTRLLSDPTLEPDLRRVVRDQLFNIELERRRLQSRGIQPTSSGGDAVAPQQGEKSTSAGSRPSSCSGCASR